MDASAWAGVANTAGSIVVVVLFLRYLTDQSANTKTAETERHAALKSIGDSCHDHSKELTAMTIEAFDRSTAALERNSNCLARVEKQLDQIAEQMAVK